MATCGGASIAPRSNARRRVVLSHDDDRPISLLEATFRLDFEKRLVLAAGATFLGKLTVDTRDGAVTASFIFEIDEEAPLGFWPFEFELAGLDPVGRYVVPHMRDCSSSLDIQTALDEALGAFYG